MGMLRARVNTKNIKGVEETLAEIAKAIDANLEDTALYVLNEAQTTTDFIDRTGNLRRSIRMKKSKFLNGGYIVIASGRHGSKSRRGFHAHLVEFGHVEVLWGRPTGRRVAPKPFLRPALEKGIRFATALMRRDRSI